ncbi:MAG: endonuclease domain-containing protein [Fusobacteriaceae bacterium]|nr:endonuclease domain-containing protein [Fusobacteriaceae bacterium]MBN2837903.1 endonuclease domain-containing protein [Fusobacteriaceae bacterium]
MNKSTYNKPSTLEKRRYLRKNMTEPEIKLWQYLRNEQLGVKFRRQHSIGEYIADFYCTKLKLVIEIDGESHFNDEAIEYDSIRTNFFKSLGIGVIRFNNDEVMTNIEGVFEIIQKILVEDKNN